MCTKYNKDLVIATADTRKSKYWENSIITWSDLVEQLKETVRTSETSEEFFKMSKEEQVNTKDVGGFVGGFCENESRTMISYRSLICLDADFVTDEDIWQRWCDKYGRAAVLHSTHKHTPDNPRYRLIIPTSRNLDLDEYEIISRKIAEDLGLETFDPSSFQPSRLMFWPSSSADADYVFKFLDEDFLNPHDILKNHDLYNTENWTVSDHETENIQNIINEYNARGTVQDPETKSGLIGLFCRTYTIREAIEKFVKDYEPACRGRYTYAKGSTEAGVVIYDEKFSYSFHATDPACMVLCNAWDIVRIHSFYDLDEYAGPDTRPGKLPSFCSMVNMVKHDAKVKAQAEAENMIDDLEKIGIVFSEDTNDIAETEADTTESDTSSNSNNSSGTSSSASWTNALKYTLKGDLQQSIENAVTILENDENLKDCIRYNEMNYNIVAVKDLPWRSVTNESQWTDADDAALRLYLESTYSIASKDKIFDAVNIVAMQHSFHPVRDFLNACEWDGVKRLDTLLIDYLGADDSEYTRTVTRKTLAAAVARVFEPGVKFDYMLTLRGAQGKGKSTLISKLGGQWFSDSFTTVAGKDAYEQLQGVWIVEIGELAGMKRAEAETIKLFISKQSDRFRPAYGRRTQEFARQCVFIGTTNEEQFLRDTTGNRRFWVVDTPNDAVKDVWNMSSEEIKQIWAEAVVRYREGEQLFLDKETEATAREIQASYEEENPRVGLILEYLDRKLPDHWWKMGVMQRREWLDSDAQGTHERKMVSIIEIWSEALRGQPDKLDRYGVKEIREIMARLPEWRRSGDKRISVDPYGRQRYYQKIN